MATRSPAMSRKVWSINALFRARELHRQDGSPSHRRIFLAWLAAFFLCWSPRIQNHIGDIAAADSNDLLSGLCASGLRRAEIAAPIRETPVILCFIAKCVHVVVEVRFESLYDLSVNQFGEAMQRQRSLPFAAVSFSIRADAAG